jgi:hypothetical protein
VELAPGAVTAAQLAPGAVGTIQLAPGAVTAAQMAPEAVTAAQIDPAQVQTRISGTCPPGQYLRGVNPDGSVVCEPFLAPPVSTTVDDPANGVGSFTSIAIGSDGLPIISHQDGTAATLQVTHCGNASCTARNVSTTVDDPSSLVGFFTSIAIGSDGLPIISHLDGTNSALRVTHCGNASCTAGNVSTTVDNPANDVGFDTSIAIGSDGLPIISHQDQTAFALRVTHCGNAACTAGNVSTTVDAPGNQVGFFTSIAIGSDGLPIISHRDQTASALRVTHCGNAACTAGNVSTTVDDPANSVGAFTSIAIGSDGLPIISHQDQTAIALRVTHCGNVACTAGNVSTTVDDPANDVGFDTSIAIGSDGLPIISHQDLPAFGLRVTKCATRTCQ